MPRAWRYDSAIGPLYIVALKDGTFGFVYDHTIWESSDSPIAEADNVRAHVTGCWDWDKLDGKVPDPIDLSEWEPVDPHEVC